MKSKILLIDDEREMEVFLQEALQGEDYELVQFTTGKEALEYLTKNKAHLILLDVQLPDMNGLEILEKIRTKDPVTRVVMITAFATVEMAVQAMKIGADDFLCKPITLENVREVVLNQLKEVVPETKRGIGVPLEEVERKHIDYVLKLNNSNRRKTAEALGISLRTLYYKIKQYDLD
ncbi:hypothetical protein CULT_550005 [[Clostridium] ultunense Esp]|uniref:response regulator n=1 Tax=Thermicanus aegyptius TaxID=94009 RepID=UPI0002B70C79|nr:response regulator [Thermicanus aegyptius]CCQ97026.1 hypothetical protein CULT_550005 [[Clostridium] ultunense Esp]